MKSFLKSRSYGVACLRSSPVLVLTLVGGGVFGNPEPAIAQAIARAHAQWLPKCPALTRVVLPLFPIGELQPNIAHALASH